MTPPGLNQIVETCPTGKRDALATLVADKLAAGSQKLQGAEIKALNSVLEDSLEGLSTGTKQHISTRLASSSVTSSRLALKLARDEACVAAPVLEQSPALSADDLKAVIHEKGQEHLGAVAKRTVLDRDVTQLLIEKGDTSVQQSIACNLGADIPPDEFERLIQSIPFQMGRRISHLRKSNDKVVEDLLRDEQEHVVGAELNCTNGRISVNVWIKAVKGGRIGIDTAIAQLNMDKNLAGIATLLAALSGLAATHMTHLILRFDATGLSVVCKAFGISTLEYATLSRVRCKHLRLPQSTGLIWSANYSVLERSDAESLLALMKLKLEQAGAGSAPGPAAPAAA